MKLGCGISIHSIPSLPLTSDQRLRWEAWITALTTGKYKKCSGGLHNTQGEFCTLGVACDLIDDTRWVEDTLDSNGDMRYQSKPSSDKGFAFYAECAFPPKDIRDLYSFPINSGFDVSASYMFNGERKDDEHTSISQINDMGATFEEVAEILKKAMTGGYRS